MVYSPKLTFVANNNNSIGVGLTLGKTIRFGSLKFIADRFSNLSLYLEGNHSGVVFVGMVHSGLSFVHTMNKESSNEGDTALGGGELQTPRPSRVQRGDFDCPITTTPPSENAPALLTILTVPLWTAAPQPGTRILPEQQGAYQEEQRA
jgi:hypothetical protein